MAANSVIFSKDYSIKAGQTFFIDNNVWMFVFCPIGGYNAKQQASASKFIEYIVQRGNNIAVNSLVLSEFSNAYLRLDFNLWKNETKNYGADFKRDYFNTERASSLRGTIKLTIKNQILKISQRFSDSFNATNLDLVFAAYKTIDFNDSVIYHECLRNNWVLVTNDGDFEQLDSLNIVKI